MAESTDAQSSAPATDQHPTAVPSFNMAMIEGNLPDDDASLNGASPVLESADSWIESQPTRPYAPSSNGTRSPEAEYLEEHMFEETHRQDGKDKDPDTSIGSTQSQVSQGAPPQKRRRLDARSGDSQQHSIALSRAKGPQENKIIGMDARDPVELPPRYYPPPSVRYPPRITAQSEDTNDDSNSGTEVAQEVERLLRIDIQRVEGQLMTFRALLNMYQRDGNTVALNLLARKLDKALDELNDSNQEGGADGL